jgi:hypothetical protein
MLIYIYLSGYDSLGRETAFWVGMETVSREPQLVEEGASASLLAAGGSAREADELCGEALTLGGEACSSCVTGVLALGGTIVLAGRAALLSCRAAFVLATSVEHVFAALFSCMSCKLPPPEPLAEDVDVATVLDASDNLRATSVLGAVAILLFIWDWYAGGASLAIWAPLGAVSAALGAVLGIAFAGLATPTSVEYSQLTEKVRVVDLRDTAISTAALAALAAAFTATAAWSIHDYPADARARVMKLVNALVLGVCAIRQGFKTWRGCAPSGRLRILLGGRRGCGCGWPAIL